MASSSLLINLLPFSTTTATATATLSKPPPPQKSPLLHLSLSSSFSPLRIRNEGGCKPLLSSSSGGFHVDVDIDEEDNGDWMVDEFRREVMRSGIIQECVRRMFHENKHEVKKRKNQDAARRNRKRRGPYRDPALDQQEAAAMIREDEEEMSGDNWDLPGGESPF